jgi:hypothetical protein
VSEKFDFIIIVTLLNQQMDQNMNLLDSPAYSKDVLYVIEKVHTCEDMIPNSDFIWISTSLKKAQNVVDFIYALYSENSQDVIKDICFDCECDQKLMIHPLSSISMRVLSSISMRVLRGRGWARDGEVLLEPLYTDYLYPEGTINVSTIDKKESLATYNQQLDRHKNLDKKHFGELRKLFEKFEDKQPINCFRTYKSH